MTEVKTIKCEIHCQNGTIHVRSAAFQGLVHSLCRGTDGETVFRKAPKGALTIYLHKIDSVRVKLFIPVPVESFPPSEDLA